MTLNRVERALGMMRLYLVESATFGRGFKQATGMATAPAIMLWSH